MNLLNCVAKGPLLETTWAGDSEAARRFPRRAFIRIGMVFLDVPRDLRLCAAEVPGYAAGDALRVASAQRKKVGSRLLHI